MSSNKVPWSTFRNSWSHTGMSSVLFSLFSSSSGGGGSSLWWVHHWITCRGERHSNKVPQAGLDTDATPQYYGVPQCWINPCQMSAAKRLRAHLVRKSMVQYRYPRCQYPTLASHSSEQNAFLTPVSSRACASDCTIKYTVQISKGTGLWWSFCSAFFTHGFHYFTYMESQYQSVF